MWEYTGLHQHPHVKQMRTEGTLKPDGSVDLVLIVETDLSLLGPDDDALDNLREAAREHLMSKPGVPYSVRIVHAK